MNKQLIFIDSQVENYQSLVEGKNSEAEVVVLKATENGIEKINNKDFGIYFLIQTSKGKCRAVCFHKTTLL